MAGHSKWAKIKRGKAAEDAKRGAIFTKLGNSIAIAAKSGGDPSMNPSLALAVEKAKAANMPNANIERSIKRGTGESGGAEINEYMYEGYGPKGVAVIVEAASDNKNRISTDIRTAFSKNGGNLAETGAVAFQFSRKGVIRLKPADIDEDELLLQVLDAGAEDVVHDEDGMTVYVEMKQLHAVSTKLKEQGLDIVESGLQYVPNEMILIEDAAVAKKAIKLLNAIEDIDDVSETYTNFDVVEGVDIG